MRTMKIAPARCAGEPTVMAPSGTPTFFCSSPSSARF